MSWDLCISSTKVKFSIGSDQNNSMLQVDHEGKAEPEPFFRDRIIYASGVIIIKDPEAGHLVSLLHQKFKNKLAKLGDAIAETMNH